MRNHLPWDFLTKTPSSTALKRGPHDCAGAEPAFRPYPKDRVVLYPQAQKAASEISSDFLHEPKIEARVASFLLGKNRIHLMQLYIPLTILLLPPTSLTQESCWQRNLAHQGKGFLASEGLVKCFRPGSCPPCLHLSRWLLDS